VLFELGAERFDDLGDLGAAHVGGRDRGARSHLLKIARLLLDDQLARGDRLARTTTAALS
jgi:hypothetical protein